MKANGEQPIAASSPLSIIPSTDRDHIEPFTRRLILPCKPGWSGRGSNNGIMMRTRNTSIVVDSMEIGDDDHAVNAKSFDAFDDPAKALRLSGEYERDWDREWKIERNHDRNRNRDRDRDRDRERERDGFLSREMAIDGEDDGDEEDEDEEEETERGKGGGRKGTEEEDTDDNEGNATVELAAIMTTNSTPVTPGPSSPPLDQSSKSPSDFIPPTRPSSTPFPNAHQGQIDIRCMTCQPGIADGSGALTLSPLKTPVPEFSTQVTLTSLPAEIHECILDHLFGYRVSTTSPSSLSIPSVNARSWSTALRHSRRKELSNLAMVMPIWRDLVQERLYRHIKLKATVDGCNGAMEFFLQNVHLRSYVKHLEIWFPVFQPKFNSNFPSNSSLALPTVSPEGISSAQYGLPTDNATLEDVFYLISTLFPDVQVMTLEGGERKKAPRVKFSLPKWDHISNTWVIRQLPIIPSIQTLIIKSQWNIIRQYQDWQIISRALPNLVEWHGTYAKPKSKSYLTMADTLEILDPKITKLNLSLETDYRREMSCPPYYLKVCEQLHWCDNFAKAAANLTHLSYTGRICHGFFDMLAKYTDPRTTKLETIDITVKNCCRKNPQWNESASGITDMHFINAFEHLVLSGIQALERLKMVRFLRIRYVDLDSPVPPLNPYFTFREGWVSGVWSETIVSELCRVRPDALFETLADSFGEVGYNKDGRLVISPDFPKSRVLSLKLSNYRMLSSGVTIV